MKKYFTKVLIISFLSLPAMVIAQSITIDARSNANVNTLNSAKIGNNIVSVNAKANQEESIPGNSKLILSGEYYFEGNATDLMSSSQNIEFSHLDTKRWSIRDIKRQSNLFAIDDDDFQIINHIGNVEYIPFRIKKTSNKVSIQNLAIPTGAGAGKILTSDVTGNASWQSPANSNWQVVGSNSAFGGFNNNITDGISNTMLVGEANNSGAGKYMYGMGWGLELQGFGTAAVGMFNTIPTSNTISFIGTDPLFIVGNGQSDSVRSNALTILKNGNTGIGVISPSQNLEVGQNALINGRLFANQKIGIGTTSISSFAKLHVFGGSSGSTLSNSSHLVRIENSDDAFLTMVVPAEKKAGIQFLKASSTEYPDQFVASIRLTETNTFDFRLGTNNTKMRLDQQGNLRIGMSSSDGCLSDGNGDIIGGTCASDLRYKKNIKPFSTLLNNFVRLNPVNFDWKSEEFPNKGFGNEQSYGFIAQEVEQIFPELVKTDENGFKAVNYTKLNIMSIQAIKELKAENDELRSILTELLSEVKELKNDSSVSSRK